MNIDTRIEILSLSFMWIFAAVFFIALLLSYKRLGYIYLKIAVLALFAELVRQTASDFTLLYPVAPFYAASSCAFVIEALLFLATVASAAGRKLGPRPYVAVIVLYAASLIFMGVWFDPAVRWHQYISYS
ncbi:MAG TPA: hypothetical protein VJ998_07475, partial [Pseudomonadales bacterium]|nr:hypothetical protein [Pseudomonadales bacterium]